MRTSLFVMLALCFIACSNICMESYEKFRPKSYYFKAQKKYLQNDKIFIIEGSNPNGTHESFREVDFRDLYDLTDIGDTIMKKAGSLNVLLIKRDTTIVIKAFCNGQELN